MDQLEGKTYTTVKKIDGNIVLESEDNSEISIKEIYFKEWVRGGNPGVEIDKMLRKKLCEVFPDAKKLFLTQSIESFIGKVIIRACEILK